MQQLDLAAIFRDSASNLSASHHLPAVVLENRQRRAQARMQDALASRGSDQVPPTLEREVRQLVRKLARQSFADGFKEMEEFEIRCAREHDLIVAQASGNTEGILEALAADHRRRVIDQYGRIELRGVQTSERVYFELDRVFVSLYLARTSLTLADALIAREPWQVPALLPTWAARGYLVLCGSVSVFHFSLRGEAVDGICDILPVRAVSVRDGLCRSMACG